jgi:hypothetical protein
MKWYAQLLIAVLATLISSSVAALEPRRAGKENSLTRAFFSEKTLVALRRRRDLQYHRGERYTGRGIDGIYRIHSNGVTQFAPLPKFKSIGGVDVSFDLPHFVVVLTSIAARHSVSIAMPMIVPR